MFNRLDEMAAERGVTRTRLVRQILDAALRDRPQLTAEPLNEDELVALLTERARAGNVAAIRALIVREAEKDPRARALALFESMVQERRQ